MSNRKQRIRAAGLAAVIGLAAAAAGAIGVPAFMNYQGVLANPQGTAFTNQTVSVNFRIYDAVRGGTMIWGTRQMVTTDSNGVFNVELGDAGEHVPGATNQVASILEVFTGTNAANRWLEIEVEYNKSSAMSPRQPFLTVPYAYQAGSAAGSAGDFSAGDVLTVASNAVFQRAVTIQDAGENALAFHDTVSNRGSLTVSQKVSVASHLSVKGALTVHGNAVFSNSVDFTENVEFDGPVVFSNGVSFRGNTTLFGAGRVLAAHASGSSFSTNGVIPTNGFLSVNMLVTDNDNGTLTFSLGSTQWLFRSHWDTGLTDDMDLKTLTLFPVKGGTTWSLNAAGDKIGFNLYYWPIP